MPFKQFHSRRTEAIRALALAPVIAGTLGGAVAGAPAAVAQTATSSDAPEDIAVIAKRFDDARDAISPTLGASDYFIDKKSIANQPQGVDTPFDQVLLQAPGISQDGFGQIHIRNEQAGLQYRIDGVTLPAGVPGLGQPFDPRVVDSIDLVTGTLPAQYGYRTAGVVAITTKSGVFDHGATVDLYGGSRGTFQPSVTASGSSGRFSYYVAASYREDDLGVDSPTGSADPIHDHTDQVRGFAHLSDILSDDARISAILGSSIELFEIPDSPGRPSRYVDQGQSAFASANLDQGQREITHYAIVALQVSGDRLEYQIAPFTRYSEAKFTPDPVGDLILDGVSDRTLLSSWSSGVQADARYALSDSHTLRAGLTFSGERTISQVTSDLFPVGPGGLQLSDVPARVYDQSGRTRYEYGLYLQDEWAISSTATLNFGGRFDVEDGYTHQNQLSPRVSLVWKPDADTTLHVGYARNFMPPQAFVMPQSIDKYLGTSKQPAILESGPVRPEREHYFDAGLLYTVIPGLDAGLDTYYALKDNLIDAGEFGQALLESPFNYRFGRAYGIELTGSYHNGPLGVYANVAYGEEKAKDIVSSQFLFNAAELAYARSHTIYTGHDQPWTISGGASYAFANAYGQLRASVDLIFGSGLRRSPVDAVEPNGEKLPSYAQVNLGLAQDIEDDGPLSKTTVRFDVMNLFDQSYELRGVGGGMPQFGPRRALYGGISKSF